MVKEAKMAIAIKGIIPVMVNTVILVQDQLKRKYAQQKPYAKCMQSHHRNEWIKFQAEKGTKCTKDLINSMN